MAQLRVDFHPNRPVDINFDAPETSSDGGFLLLRRVDDELGISRRIAGLVPDEREPSRVQHGRLEQVRQRIYQLAAGYEDCNDADFMRHDKLLKTCCDRLPDGAGLSSQPTLSRMENSVGMKAVRAVVRQLEDDYLASLPEGTEAVVLDIDGFADPTHGGQQLSLFSGYYRQFMYFPLAVFDEEGELVTVLLRGGTVRDDRGARYLLDRLIRKLKRRFPFLAILVRGDSHFATDRLMGALEALNGELGGVDYLFGLAKNRRLQGLLAPFMEAARGQYEETHRTAKVFASFPYKTKRTWLRERHVVGSASYSSEGANPRFVVTTLSEFPPWPLYNAYSQRGQAENRIKQFKNSVQADRLSCSTFVANFFRLLLHAAAYRLLFALRKRVAQIDQKLGQAQFDTLRLRLLKVAAIVTQSARRILVRLPTVFPLANLFRRMALPLAYCAGPAP